MLSADLLILSITLPFLKAVNLNLLPCFQLTLSSSPINKNNIRTFIMKVQNVFFLLAAQAIGGVMSAPIAASASTLQTKAIEKKGVAEVWANWNHPGALKTEVPAEEAEKRGVAEVWANWNHPGALKTEVPAEEAEKRGVAEVWANWNHPGALKTEVPSEEAEKRGLAEARAN
ncbi:hypothetical protein ONS96_004943 [Cadophora gregata f. sp. sojae]|nr:hypothetical protein ONS96_004943 [Cadophora gregata f. sp. sojae]